MSNQNISQNPSARELLKAAIFCFAHTVARQQMAGMDLDEKKSSSEKFLELENDVHIMDNEMCYLIDMLNSGTPSFRRRVFKSSGNRSKLPEVHPLECQKIELQW